jgi:glycosyltransferase involved in cell wall biosynthesis
VQRFAPVNVAPANDHPFTFLVIARLLVDKGIMEYAEAARRLRQRGVRASFQLLGARDPQHRRGIPDATVDAWIEEGLIDYLGTTDDVRPFIARADAVVLPSYREGLPRTLLEAASMEKPLVTTDTPGCRHVVTDGHNGLLCPARDTAGLAETMHRLQQMTPTERQQMGQRGRALVTQRFSEEYVINEYLSYCSSAINPHSGSAINRATVTTNHHHERTTPLS